MGIQQVGIIGLGRTGAAIAARLVEHGFEVTGYDRDPERARAATAAGIATAQLPADAAETADVVIVTMPDVIAADEVLFDLGGVGETLRTGGYVVDASRVGPAFSRSATARLARFGIVRLEAWVSGDGAQARTGDLRLFVGGDSDDLSAVTPLLASVATEITHVGPIGSAAMVRQIAVGLGAVRRPAMTSATKPVPTGGIAELDAGIEARLYTLAGRWLGLPAFARSTATDRARIHTVVTAVLADQAPAAVLQPA